MKGSKKWQEAIRDILGYSNDGKVQICMIGFR